MNLRIPGPTPLPQRVIDAMARQMINHRSAEFGNMLGSILERLRTIFATQHDVLPITASGTGGLEAAIENFFSPGDEIIATSIGYFGNRWIEIAQRHGLRVIILQKPWGSAVKRDELAAALGEHPACKAVLLTHAETSTGAVNNIPILADIAASRFGKLVFVDAVSSLGALPLETDAWQLDVVVTASQKALMAPPGLSFISVSDRAWNAHETAKISRYFFDLTIAKALLKEGQTPSTPPVSVCFGIDASLDMILEEGMAEVVARHKRIAERFRADVVSAGWSLFADPSCFSDTVTALNVPEGVDGRRMMNRLEKEYGIAVGGGLGSLSGKILRIAHMGNVSQNDMDDVVYALRELKGG